jgi:hypothetical protein
MYNFWEGQSVANDELWLGALDGVGRVQWMKGYGGTSTTDNGVLHNGDTYPSLSLTQDGGALLVGFTEGFGSDQRNLWSVKVPAKNGAIVFDPESTAQTRDLPYQGDDRFCATLEDYPVTPVDHPMTAESLDVTVHEVPIVTSHQTAP